MMKKRLMLIAFALLLSPAAARADWLFTPQIGSTFGTQWFQLRGVDRLGR
jgi:hypothetical protein